MDESEGKPGEGTGEQSPAETPSISDRSSLQQPDETCEICGSADLQEIRCKVVCRNCRTILRTCSDL